VPDHILGEIKKSRVLLEIATPEQKRALCMYFIKATTSGSGLSSPHCAGTLLALNFRRDPTRVPVF
jgi:hypothetical protein